MSEKFVEYIIRVCSGSLGRCLDAISQQRTTPGAVCGSKAL